MRTVHVDMSSDRRSYPPLFGGYEGEHKETHVEVVLPERLQAAAITEYHFIFETGYGECIQSPAILKAAVKNGVITVDLWNQLMVAKQLKFCVAGYKRNGDEFSLIAKSGSVALTISNDVSGVDTTISLGEVIDPDKLGKLLADTEKARDGAIAAAGDAKDYANEAKGAVEDTQKLIDSLQSGVMKTMHLHRMGSDTSRIYYTYPSNDLNSVYVIARTLSGGILSTSGIDMDEQAVLLPFGGVETDTLSLVDATGTIVRFRDLDIFTDENAKYLLKCDTVKKEAVVVDKICGVTTVDTDSLEDGAVTPEKTTFAHIKEWTAGAYKGSFSVTYGTSGDIGVKAQTDYLLYDQSGSMNPPDYAYLVMKDETGSVLTCTPVGQLTRIQTSNIVPGAGWYIHTPVACSKLCISLIGEGDLTADIHYDLYDLTPTLQMDSLMVTGGNLENGAVTADNLAGESVTMAKLGSDVKEALSGALKREMVLDLPSDEYTTMAKSVKTVTGTNKAGDDLLLADEVLFESVRDVSAVTASKQLRMTVTLTRNDGQTGAYHGGGIRIKNPDDQQVTYSMPSEQVWQDGDNHLIIPLNGFDDVSSAVWSRVNKLLVFVYSNDKAAEGVYSITVSNVRIVDTAVQQEIQDNTIYMVLTSDDPQNIYDEYLYLNGAWERIGSTAIDLTDYYTKAQVDAVIRDAMYTVVDATADTDGTYWANGIKLSISGDHAVVGDGSGGTANAMWSNDQLIIPAYIRIPSGQVYEVTEIDAYALVCNWITASIKYEEARVYIPRTIKTYGTLCFLQYYGESGGHLHIITDSTVDPTGYDADTTTVYNLSNPFGVVDLATKASVEAINTKVGDIDTVLDSIIAIQTSLIGGATA